MTLDVKVLQLSDIEEILEFEEKKLIEQFVDENERVFQRWHARWRRESLEHYLPLGWSFVCRDNSGGILGYFIGQPFLFMNGWTQTFWIEHLQHSSLQARDFLCEVAYKMAREKHFQVAMFPKSPQIANAIQGYKPIEWGDQVLMVKTAKI